MFPWIICSSGERPKPEILRVDLSKISKTFDQCDGIRMKPRLAIDEVLDQTIAAREIWSSSSSRMEQDVAAQFFLEAVLGNRVRRHAL